MKVTRHLKRLLCFLTLHKWIYYFDLHVDEKGNLTGKEKFCGWCGKEV